MSEYKICQRCVMDTSDSAIVFNEFGICDHCVTFDRDIMPIWNGGVGREKELELIVDEIRCNGKGKDFDCILGMSGGIIVHIFFTW